MTALSTELESLVSELREHWLGRARHYIESAFRDNAKARETGDICVPPDRWACWLLGMDIDEAYVKRHCCRMEESDRKKIAGEIVGEAWDAYWKEAGEQ